MRLEILVKDFILKNKLMSCGDKLLLGVSGGGDSVALLSILNDLKHELGLTLNVAHFNHHLRKGAKLDEKHVRSLAKKFHIPSYFGLREKRLLKQKGSVEELAREKRFAFLIKTAKKIKANSVVLAHHKDDLAETVLMRLLRGTGLEGIRAIMPQRKIEGMPFIRPLLPATRKQIESYLKKKNLTFREDPTNRLKTYTRNRIRKNLIPYLKKNYNKNVTDVLANFSQNTAVDFDYLAKETSKQLTRCLKENKAPSRIVLSLGRFQKNHLSLQRSILRQCLKELQGSTRQIESVHIYEIEDLISERPLHSVVHLPNDISIQKRTGELILSQKG